MIQEPNGVDPATSRERRRTDPRAASDANTLGSSNVQHVAIVGGLDPSTKSAGKAVPTQIVPSQCAFAAEHRRQLDESGIAQDVAEERGYRTVSKKSEMKGLGFSEAQCRVPALLIPVYGVNAEIVTYQARPDEARVVGGKAIKYETPKGSSMALDVPRRVHDQLGDPALPLWITEGAKKADAAVSHGLCAIALLGVWNWRGTNESGGKTALSDWERIALNGRRIYLAFDSDVIEKTSVHAALGRLKGFLESKGAGVKVIRLPAGPSGAKVGLDDYLAAGNSIQDLLGLAADQLPRPVDAPDRDGGIYFVRDNSTYQRKQGRDGEVEVQLANFSATIKAEVLLDDGQETAREFELEGVLPGGSTVVFDIPARSFSCMNWPIEHLGAVACVSPGLGARDHLRAAIQALSGRPEPKTVFTHSGWRHVDGVGWVYLHAGGSIGPKGPISSTHTRLSGAAAGMVLPDPPVGPQLTEAIGAAFRFLDLGPDHLVFPLFAATFRAALGSTDYSLYLYGTTGTFKTATAAICQSFFGTGYHSRNLPGSFMSTSNALEMQAFQLKDSLFVVDDWVPEGSGQEVQRQHAVMGRLLRSQGNLQGRGRLASDASQRASKPPRGLILVTAEDVPSRLSAIARTLQLEVRPGDVRTDVLTILQAHVGRGTFAEVMSAFLCWVASRYTDVKRSLSSRAQELRDNIGTQTSHRRTASIAGDLQAGFETLLAFCQEVGALDVDRVEGLREASWRAIQFASAAQSSALATSEPTAIFFRLLASAIGSGRAHVECTMGGAPRLATSLGWRPTDPGQTGFDSQSNLKPLGACVGWTDGENLFLDLDAALKEAQCMASDGERITVGGKALSKRLHEKGYLLTTDQARGHLTVRRQIVGRRMNVLHLGMGVLMESAQPTQSAHGGPGDSESGGCGPILRADSGGDGSGIGPPNRPLGRSSVATRGAAEQGGAIGPNGPIPETGPLSALAVRDDDISLVSAVAAEGERDGGGLELVDDDSEVV